MRDCDCDECGFITVPPTIADAIRQHKRQRTSHSLTRRQDRSLVARVGNISIWKLTMPVDAEPLIEFGNSHRIVLVDALSSVRFFAWLVMLQYEYNDLTILCSQFSSILSIGKGVVGSSDETRGRKTVHWREGTASLIPQNGGKALGWIHSKNDDAQEPVGHAIMYFIKVTLDVLEKKEEETNDLPKWAQNVVELFRKNLKSFGKEDHNATLDDDDTTRLKNIINELEENEKSG